MTRLQKELAENLLLSQSEISEGIGRCIEVKLFDAEDKSVNVSNLMELLVHALKFFFPAEHQGLTRGIPTAWATASLSEKIKVPLAQTLPVWAHPGGSIRGIGLVPLHKNIPEIALRNPQLHMVYALIDTIRIGRTRERDIASKLLEAMFRNQSKNKK